MLSGAYANSIVDVFSTGGSTSAISPTCVTLKCTLQQTFPHHPYDDDDIRIARSCFGLSSPSSSPIPFLERNRKVLALPRPSSCPTVGQLSIDLHLLRRSEAVSVVEAVLTALHSRQGHASPGSRPNGRLQSPTTLNTAGGGSASGGASSSRARGEGRGRASPEIRESGFRKLEVVVGRGSHSGYGVARLRPVVVRYLASKGFPAQAIDGERGEGVVLVDLGGNGDG